jgi:hypothetical protein
MKRNTFISLLLVLFLVACEYQDDSRTKTGKGSAASALKKADKKKRKAIIASIQGQDINSLEPEAVVKFINNSISFISYDLVNKESEGELHDNNLKILSDNKLLQVSQIVDLQQETSDEPVDSLRERLQDANKDDSDENILGLIQSYDGKKESRKQFHQDNPNFLPAGIELD